MCDGQSPARRNAPEVDRPEGSAAHAGFRAVAPTGVVAASGTTGPRLAGWPRQIAWDEFTDRASRPSGESEDAQISVQLAPGRVSIVRDGRRFKLGNVTFQMSLVHAQSWVVTSRKTSTLLAHEQGHYDIVGLCYRDMMAELRSLRERSQGRLARAVRRIMGEHDQRADGLSAEYDASQQTNHGRNVRRQQAWEAQIQACRRSGSRLTAPP